MPPPEYWPNLVQTLRFIHEQVVPADRPGRGRFGLSQPDAQPAAPAGRRKARTAIIRRSTWSRLRPTTREMLIRDLCNAHARRGGPYGVGLGFYVGVRFHVDSRKYRSWGAEGPGRATPAMSSPPPLPIAAPPADGPHRRPFQTAR